MKSIVAHDFSHDLSQLEIVEKEIPEPGPSQLRVRVLYAAVNPSDFNFIRRDYQQALSRLVWNKGQDKVYFDPARIKPYPAHPYVLGAEGVGIVEACGDSLLARRLKGKRVAFTAGPPNGAWQEYLLIDAKQALVVPKSLADEQAAMYTVNPLSSYAMIRKILKVKSGQYVLQSAANSALGQMVIRLSKEFGFKTINIIRDGQQAEHLKALGADEIIVMSQEDIQSRVAEITKGQGVPYALDCIGGELASTMLSCMGLAGHMVFYGTLSGPECPVYSRDLMMPGLKVEGFFAGNWLAQQSTLSLLSTVRQMSKLAQRGVFSSPVGDVFPFERFSEALQLSQKAGKGGKVLLKFHDQ